MQLCFLGTRGNVRIASRLHRRHSALLVKTGEGQILFDCGADWKHRLDEINPDAIFLTHAHPDHAHGLSEGAPCPVYATAETLALIKHFPIAVVRPIDPARATEVGGLRIRAYRLIHSHLAPAVGYRVTRGGATLFYAPDIVDIADRRRALNGVDLYVGDGASPTRPLIRWRGRTRFGHTTIRAQLAWCARAGIGAAIFTHCGSQIVRSDGRVMNAKVRALAKEYGIAARIARDGLELPFPSSPGPHSTSARHRPFASAP